MPYDHSATIAINLFAPKVTVSLNSQKGIASTEKGIPALK
jgi:hypothetical protein